MITDGTYGRLKRLLAMHTGTNTTLIQILQSMMKRAHNQLALSSRSPHLRLVPCPTFSQPFGAMKGHENIHSLTTLSTTTDMTAE